MYSSTTSGRGSDSPNPFSTNASPPNSFDSRDPFETASSRQSNHPNYYRDGEYSEMGDTIPREPTLESEANLVGRNRADSYTTQGGGYDPYHGQFEFRLPARKNGSSAPLVALPNLGGRSNNANSPPNRFFFYNLRWSFGTRNRCRVHGRRNLRQRHDTLCRVPPRLSQTSGFTSFVTHLRLRQRQPWLRNLSRMGQRSRMPHIQRVSITAVQRGLGTLCPISSPPNLFSFGRLTPFRPKTGR